jgi:hypothetical protein
MKATSYLGILALAALAGCATEPTTVATAGRATTQPPSRILIENHPLPVEVWGARSALVGKDSP